MKIESKLDTATRHKIGDALGPVLADTYTLYLATHNFHWNVTGPMFQTLHGLFMTQYNELWLAIDEIAERMRTLGVRAPGNGSELARLTRLKEPDGAPAALAMVKYLCEGHEIVTETCRGVLGVAEGGKDKVTVDLLTRRMLEHEKAARMLRSLLE